MSKCWRRLMLIEPRLVSPKNPSALGRNSSDEGCRAMIRALLGISTLLVLGEVFFLAGQGWSPRTGHEPEQPIPFSHKLHAGEMQINCQYCHTQVEKGRHATVPSVNICMNCHSQVKRASGADKDSVHLAKLTEHYEKMNRSHGSKCLTCRITYTFRTSRTSKRRRFLAARATVRLKRWRRCVCPWRSIWVGV